MLQIAHTGLYVKDIGKMTSFYINVFGMHVICENVIQKDLLVSELLKKCNASIKITKLISDQGKLSGIDDMIELIEVDNQELSSIDVPIYKPGIMHICFRVDDLSNVVGNLLTYGGELYTSIVDMNNGRKCCFARDVEGNYLELIEVLK